jgi:hypothetical protein
MSMETQLTTLTWTAKTGEIGGVGHESHIQ